MNPPSIVIPFKAGGGKSRLASVLSEKERLTLSGLMLLDVLDALKAAGLSRRCVIVSPDLPDDIEAKSGAEVIRERSARGVNSAVQQAMAAVSATESVMVVPSDLPTLRAGEVKRVLELFSSGLEVVISPSHGFNGTNLLLFGKGDRIPLSYDKDSFWNHIVGTARLGLSLCVYAGRGFMFDIDTPGDLAALSRSKAQARSVAFAKKLFT